MAQVRKNLECQTDCLEKKADRIGDAIEQEIDDMPNDFEIRKFIVSNKAEVKDMCLTEYNEAETMEMLKIPLTRRLDIYAELSKDT